MQFSHFSVKEYLTSARLATSIGDVPRFHIVLEPAHTILAQACMGVLLQPEDGVKEDGIRKMSPLAGYAARHWATHAQFERVSLSLRKAMEHLFDVDKPHFSAWLQLYDIDIYRGARSSSFYLFAVYVKSGATPLYYAALCGFEDLVEHLAVKYPEHVDSIGGRYVTPLFAALAGRHFQTAKLLYHNGTDMNVRGDDNQTALFFATCYGDLEMVQVLLDYKADPNARDCRASNLMCDASGGTTFDVDRLLREPVVFSINSGRTPLIVAVLNRRIDIVRMLLEHGANVGSQDNAGSTALHMAALASKVRPGDKKSVDMIRMLLEHGADVGAKDFHGMTAFQPVSDWGYNAAIAFFRALMSEHDDKGVL